MVERNRPCEECRKRRRKCIRTSIYDICSRCRRLERECIESDEDINYTGYDKELSRLQKQVEELNLILKEMERQAKSLLSYNNQKNNDRNNDNDNDKRLAVNNSINNNKNNNNNNSKLWTLTFHNGALRIETGIRSISDLLEQCLPIQYLSPLQLSSKKEDNLIIQFDTGKSIRFMPFTVKLLVKCVTPVFDPISFLSPITFDIDYVVEELINVYFSCRNTYKPLIHQNTFMQYYRGLKSPLDSLVCLSICCSVCATPCNHVSHDPYKFRQLGDFFFDLAKDKLMNQFDEAKYRLENLISINLMSDYMLAVLKLKDFKNFVKIGYQTCLDLDTWFESTKDQGNTVERTLYTRHFSIIACSQSLLSLITDEPMHHLTTIFPEWLIMYDDPPEVANSVSRQNYLLRLYNHPYLFKIKAQIHYQLRGHPFTLTFDTIIQLDSILIEWWRAVPSQYQVCVEWLDLDKCKAAIDKCNNSDNLVFFNQFLALMVDIYSVLLQPKAMKSTDDQILSFVQELALRRSLHCSEVLIYSQCRTTVLRTPPSCHSILTINDYILHSMDAVIIMSLSANHTVRTKAQAILAQSQYMIENIPFMHYHRIVPSRSPLLESIRANDLNSINLSEYYTYPQPWFAMLYDLSQHLDKAQIGNGIP